MPRRHTGRRVALALLASVLLHVCLWLWLRSLPPPPAPAAVNEPIELTIEEPAARIPPAPPAPAPESAPATPPPTHKQKHAAERTARAPQPPPAAPENAPKPVEQVAQAPAHGKPDTSSAPLANSQPSPPQVSNGVPSSDLLPSGSWAMRVDPGMTSAEAAQKLRGDHPGATLHAPETPKDAKELVAQTSRHVQAQNRAELGFEHPYFKAVGKSLADAWHPEPLFQSSGGLIEQVKKDLSTYSRAWSQRASEYGRGRSPLADDVPTTAANNPLNSPSERMQQMQGAVALANGIRLVNHVTLKVIQDEEGKIINIEIINPSEDLEMDHLALKDVRSAALKLGRPPVELLDEQSHLVSLWSFEVVVNIKPPTGLGMDFDPALGIAQPSTPFAKRITKKVRLLEGN